MPAHDDPADDHAPDRPVLSPADEAAVRARLAEARHTDPVPDDVVARLDAVLADLTADRREAPAEPVAPVVPLGSRRRRALASGLVAAAAVVALGVALPQVLDSTGGSDDSMSAGESAGDTAVQAPEAESDGGSDGGGSAEESGPGELAEEPGASSERSGSAFAAPLALRSDQPLRPAVRRLTGGGPALDDADTGCAPGTGAGERVDATWDGRPAVVVLRPATAGRQIVDVYVCGSDEAVGTTTLRVR